MEFPEAAKSGFKHYATFSGRATRSEYWYWVLFIILVSAGMRVLDVVAFGANIHDPGTLYPLSTLFSLTTLLPSLAVAARRLHDINRSGWWLLILLIPLIGFIVFLVWACQESNPGDNQYGPQPVG